MACNFVNCARKHGTSNVKAMVVMCASVILYNSGNGSNSGNGGKGVYG